MFKDVASKTVDGYLASVPAERKEIIEFLHEHIQETSPELKPFFAYNMIGYGKFKYKNYKKENIDWPIIALVNQKNYISIYICALEGGQYIAEKYKDILGKVSVGKSCIRFKKLDDLNLETLDRVIRLAADNPGLV